MKHLSKTTRMRSGGFTLIEVLIATVIFATSLSVLLSFVGTGIGDVNVAKNKLVGNYLAQEGLELVRYKRDYLVETSSTPDDGWAQFLSSPYMQDCADPATGSGGPCGVDSINPTAAPIACGSGLPNCLLLLDSTTGAYDNAGDPRAVGWDPTMYTRYVYADGNNSGTDQLTVHSVVTWKEGTGTYQVNLSETLYNWF